MKNIIKKIKQKYLEYWIINQPAMLMIHGFFGLIIIFKIINAFF